MNDLRAIIGDYDDFLTQLLAETTQAGFDLADFVQMDHVGYRVPTTELYLAKQKELSGIGELLRETQVNGRPISTFRLREPIHHDQWRIDTVELPAPKPGTTPREGLDHAEFVLFDSIEAFVAKHPNKAFNMDAATRGINPQVAYTLPNCVVKFHLLNLATVVYLERKLDINDVRDGQ